MHQQLSIFAFLPSSRLEAPLQEFLGGDRYILQHFQSETEFLETIKHQKKHLDCLILEETAALPHLVRHLCQHSILLPAVIFHLNPDVSDELICPLPAVTPLESRAIAEDPSSAPPPFIYHGAEIRLILPSLERIVSCVEAAIAAFLKLSPERTIQEGTSASELSTKQSAREFVMLQQERLAEKLKERLGYLGVYYKRDSQRFLRNLPQPQKQKFLEQLKARYREIVLGYFSDDRTINQKIDDFVDMAFFADISVTRIVETHMELMEEFAKQLKLEGRSEEVLLDYRLTLIDTIAHLCEMYRRSIPRDS